MNFFHKIWRSSIFRFYWLNAKWNIGFWMNAKACYEERKYTYIDETISGIDMHLEPTKKVNSYKRFKGYLYNSGVYWDNPGVQCSVDQETRAHWFKKRWI